MEYKVLASLRDEMNQGWVWSTNTQFESRSIVKITNLANNKSIYCEHLEIENNYKFTYNNPPRTSIENSISTITINSWYRAKLGNIDTKTNHKLDIKAANNIYGKLFANIGHPQVVVRMATWLAILSVVLGVLSVCLSLK